MILSKRERYIVIGTVAAIGLLVLDHFVITPYFDARDTVQQQTDQVRKDMDDATALFSKKEKLTKVWGEIQDGGLKSDSSDAESQAWHAVLDWMQQAGVELVALKPGRQTAKGKFLVSDFHASGTGSMAAVSRLLWAIETSSIPLRITDIQITSRKEGTDDLNLQLGLSTLNLQPTSDAHPKTAMTSMSSSEGQL